jgi:hypothetical protein
MHAQQEALFIFFVAGCATVESFSYALFALGAMLRPTDFPMSIPSQRRGITPGLTQTKFATHFGGTPVEAALSTLVADLTYKKWRRIRNVLAHRIAPARQRFVTIHEGLQSSNVGPANPDPVWQIVGGIPLNDQTTSDRRAWLAKRLTEQVHATEIFVNANFP